jgi:hypothetical protein
MIPSYISLLDYSWDALGSLPDKYTSKEYVLKMAEHWYRYPLRRLEEAPENSYMIVNFNDLVRDPQRTVEDIYQRFGLKIDDDFAQILRKETEKARNYKSSHKYSLEDMGLDQKEIVMDFQYLFDRFQFDTR